MTEDLAEKLGGMADSLDSALYTAKMPLPPHIHLDALTGIIREARDLLVKTVIEATGENPWETNPLEG